jgi:ribosomal protein L7Ae-like RNA K-turn-binding protein
MPNGSSYNNNPDPKWFSTLGLAMRAGKVASGEEIVLQEIRSGRAKLVILANDASANTTKKFTDKCRTYQVPLLRLGEKEELGRAIGKGQRAVIALLDEGFARLIKSYVE